MSTDLLDLHLTPKETARRLRTTERGLQAMRQRGKGPAYIRTGRNGKILYPLEAIKRWEKKHYVETHDA